MAKMPPPGTEGHGVAIIIGTPKGGASSDRMPPPGMPDKDPNGKASRDEAGFVGAEQHCVDCEIYDVQTGDCSKVEGSMDPQDGCSAYFQPVSDSEGDNDADDSNGVWGEPDSMNNSGEPW